MTCTGCEAHVNQEIENLPGVFNVNTSYQQEMATVTFDSTRINASAIVEAARKTGYSISLKER